MGCTNQLKALEQMLQTVMLYSKRLYCGNQVLTSRCFSLGPAQQNLNLQASELHEPISQNEISLHRPILRAEGVAQAVEHLPSKLKAEFKPQVLPKVTKETYIDPYGMG